MRMPRAAMFLLSLVSYWFLKMSDKGDFSARIIVFKINGDDTIMSIYKTVNREPIELHA